MAKNQLWNAMRNAVVSSSCKLKEKDKELQFFCDVFKNMRRIWGLGVDDIT